MNRTRDILLNCWRAAWRYPKNVIGIFIAVPLAMLFNSFLPQLIASGVLERLSAGDYNPQNVWSDFGGTLMLYLLVALTGAVVLWRIVSFLVWTMEIRAVKDLHNRMFGHLMNMDLNFHANHFGGSLVSQVNKMANSYIIIQDVVAWEVMPLLCAIGFSSIILWPKAPLYVVGLLAFSVVFIVIAIVASRLTRKYAEAEAATENKLTGLLADAITNVSAIKSFAAHKVEERLYDGALKDWAKAETKVMVTTQVRQTVFATITSLLSWVSLGLAVISVVVFHSDVSTIFLVVNYTAIVGQNLWEFSSQTMRNYNRAIGDAKAMTKVLGTPALVQDNPSPEKLRITKGAIAFNTVDFTHSENKKDDGLFSGLSLKIAAGKKIGLVGHSGSGKTTLTRLLLRFSDIDGGAIEIDGQNIAKIKQDDLRSKIAYVPQEPLLFHRSLRENIAYGKPKATLAEIKEAARKANAAEFIDKLPNGYETTVGERGVKLSGGQRQRIAIARAMLKNAPILVLDEATSALDSESEKLIQAALWELMKGRTAIVIAHRLSTIQRMDEIVVLEDGAILEQGSHDQLLKNNGKYAELWGHQSGGFIEE